jgi:hypothetical protein
MLWLSLSRNLNGANLSLGGTITPKCIQIHYVFHYILSEFGHFYLGETSQPLIVTNSELVH